MAAEWYFRATGGEFGPVSTADLVQGAVEGRIVPDTEVRKGDGPWVPASKVAGLFDRATQARTSESNPQITPQASEGASVFVPATKPTSAIPSSGNFEILDMAETDGFKVEILAYPKLGGAKDHQTAANVYFANQAGIRLKQVRITLRDGEAVAESGALHFMLGHVQMESKVGGVSGLGKAPGKSTWSRLSATS
jgi:GYF domain 2